LAARPPAAARLLRPPPGLHARARVLPPRARGPSPLLRGARAGGEHRPLPRRRADGGGVLRRGHPGASGLVGSSLQSPLPARAERCARRGAPAPPPPPPSTAPPPPSPRPQPHPPHRT